MTMNPENLKKLTKARATMIVDQPFFGTLALRLELLPMGEPMRQQLFTSRNLKPTMAVDGRHIFFDEKFVEETELTLLKSALAHEVGHCVFDHISRRGARDPDKWNAAGDYVINDVLKDAGFKLSDNWLHNPAYKGMSADHIYNLLPDQPPGGGGAGGQGPACHILDGSSDEADATVQRHEWTVATIQAATAAKQKGKLPSSLERFVDHLTKPKVDWREMLRQFISARTKEDYNWSRPNRRYLSMGFYLPTLYSERMETLVVVTDDSGSIGQEEINAFCAEINASRDATKPKRFIHLSCDAAVNHAREYDEDMPFKFESHGGGGTSFKPPFEWLRQRDVTPTALLYLTDMYGDFPEDPGYPVMWVATSDVKGPFGETIKLDLGG